jgi:hypothetical protein
MRHLRPLCSQCIYWVVDRNANPRTTGHCHRYPPVISVNPNTGAVVQKFPTTTNQHWCGEWSHDEMRVTDGIRQTLEDSCNRPQARQ